MYDPTCQDLAEHFLQEEPFLSAPADQHRQRVAALSDAIQQAVEAWCESHPLPSPPDPKEPR